MTPRERLHAALNHKEPDRVPIDLGGIVTGISEVAHRRTREYLEIPGREIIIDLIQQLVRPEEELLRRFGVDTRYVYLTGSRDHSVTDQFENENPEEYTDEWGVRRRRAYLNTGGAYYDIVHSPFAGMSLGELKTLELPDPYEAGRLPELSEEARRLHESSEYGVIVNAIGSVFEFTWYTRGFEQFLMDLVLDPEAACYLMDRMLDFQLGLFDQILEQTGSYVDVVMVGDDLGGQNGPTFSPDQYRKYVKPRQKRLFDFIRSKTDAKLFYHSCGSARAFLPDLIDIGVDIINPVQVAAHGMDTAELKREFGNELTFWGGVDTQSVLPFGNPDQVREEVKRRIDDLAPGGGYVLNAVHNIQSDVPPENVVALFDAALEYGGY
ncbi:MAG: hypothetical protein K9L68_03735 [Spirochaetales bacterium]|nr:hypothetical protein [Spirochaetales bacterium]MCF7937690.1 hypothetical protein [Spirochaetales bacterium]